MAQQARTIPGVAFVLLVLIAAACGGSTAVQTPTPSPSPSPTPNAGPLQRYTLDVDGRTRAYFLFRPPSTDPTKQASLILLLHPCPLNLSPGDITGNNFDEQAAASGFLTAWPQGIGGCWNAGGCCSPGIDDVTFIGRLIDKLTTDLSISHTLVFVAGLSNGGGMAYRVACELSNQVTGVASVSGAMLLENCHPARPVSVLIMHGTADEIYPYDGGGQYGVPPVMSVSRQWATLDGCAGSPIQSESGITKTSEWKSCSSGVAVKFETITGAPHGWFGLEPNPLAGEPQATTEVLSFFSTH